MRTWSPFLEFTRSHSDNGVQIVIAGLIPFPVRRSCFHLETTESPSLSSPDSKNVFQMLGNGSTRLRKNISVVKDGEERLTAAEVQQAQADGWEKQYQYKVSTIWRSNGEKENAGYGVA